MKEDCYLAKEHCAAEALDQGLGLYAAKKFAPAVKAFKEASTHGSGEAAYYVGCCYQKNLGVGEMKEEARLRCAEAWYLKGALRGDHSARNALKHLCGHDAGAPVNEVPHQPGTPERPKPRIHHSTRRTNRPSVQL
jgi:hypothetical protein